MEAAARPSRPDLTAPAQAAVAPKLAIDRFSDGGITCLRFGGTIDEAFEGKKLASTIKADTLILDLGGVKKISSFGIREWVDFIGSANKQVRRTFLIECAPKVVDQLNMVANFTGDGMVFSFYAPFRCDYCDSEHRALLQVDRDWDAIKSMKLIDRACPTCGEAMYFDEDPATFFSYILGRERFELDAEIAAFLATKLDYAMSDGARKLRVDKLIEGRYTFVRLTGDLDGGFPRDKLAEGLEGTIVVDVAGVGRIEPAGAAEWRGFVHQVAPLVESIFIVGANPPFVEKLGHVQDLGDKARILTLTLPYACPTCQTTAGQAIDVFQHYDMLKFATAPELKCGQCKSPMTCAAAEAVMTILPGLPPPIPTPELYKAIEKFRTHKPEKKKPSTVAEVAVSRRSGGLWIPFAAAGLAVALAAGAFFGWRALNDDSRTKPGRGTLVSASAAARPAWLTSDAPSTSYCTDRPDKSLSCVGASAFAAAEDEGRDEARDAALEAVAGAIANRIADPRWRAKIAPIWAQVRQAKLAAYERSPDSSQARRDVRDARRAVAQWLSKTGGTAVPSATGHYWEEYDSTVGRRFQSFVEVSMPAADVARLVEHYAGVETALGATVMTGFPQLAWRWPRLESGAVVVAVKDGSELARTGVAEQYVVLQIGGRDVVDAKGFARLAGEERERLSRLGGGLQLQVQADDASPKLFAFEVPRVASSDDDDDDRGGKSGKGGKGGKGGNVNVFDQYDYSKKPKPDDPRQ